MEWYEASQDGPESIFNGGQDVDILQGFGQNTTSDAYYANKPFNQYNIQSSQSTFSNFPRAPGIVSQPYMANEGPVSAYGESANFNAFSQGPYGCANGVPQNVSMPYGQTYGGDLHLNNNVNNNMLLQPQEFQNCQPIQPPMNTGFVQPTKVLPMDSGNHGMGFKDPFPAVEKGRPLPPQPPKQDSAGITSHSRKREIPPAEKAEEKPAKRGPKRSLAATIERMEKHKVLERKRREKTKELMSELQALIPTVENVEESLTMNTVLEEAIQHLKEQHAQKQQQLVPVKKETENGEFGGLAGAFSNKDNRDGLSIIQSQDDDLSVFGGDLTVPSQNPSAISEQVAALEKSSSSKTLKFNIARMPDQEFKYFRLVLMQETLYAKMLQRWEAKMGLELVRDSLSLLCISRQGLSLQELEEILKISESGKAEQWADFKEALNADVAVKSEGLLGFVYSAFRLAVERRYLSNPEDVRKGQLRLAEYFEDKHKSDQDVKRAASELPYVLESVGEWSRLRKCLSSSLDMLYQLYNDKDKADLLRFWRQGGDVETSGYQEASKCYVQRLQKFEQEGMAPQMLWQSSLITARFLGDAGQFKEAENILEKARELTKELGGEDKLVAEVSLRCAELLNKWAASSPEYTEEMMVRSAQYAKEAADLFAELGSEDAKEDHASALYWMGLNFGTLCRIGGGGVWGSKEAHEIALQSLNKCQELQEELNSPQVKRTEILFGKAVLSFCKAEAMSMGSIQPQVKTCKEEIQELLEASLQHFLLAYSQFSEAYSPSHLDAIKCVTMLGLVHRRLNRLNEALEWSRKEVLVREEVQGLLHPRTQQAHRVYKELISKVQETKDKTSQSFNR